MEIVGLFDAYYVVEYISVCEELRDLLYVALLWSFEKDEIYTTIILLGSNLDKIYASVQIDSNTVWQSLQWDMAQRWAGG